jgi:hypothetical protein
LAPDLTNEFNTRQTTRIEHRKGAFSYLGPSRLQVLTFIGHSKRKLAIENELARLQISWITELAG